MRKFSMIYVASAALIATPAIAQTPPQSAPVPIPAGQSDVNKIVCERQEEIGSRLKGKKVCLTVQQWREFKNQSRDDVEEMQRHANTGRSG